MTREPQFSFTTRNGTLPRPTHTHYSSQNIDDAFQRAWEFYLAYCEAGFRNGALGDVQLLLERG